MSIGDGQHPKTSPRPGGSPSKQRSSFSPRRSREQGADGEAQAVFAAEGGLAAERPQAARPFDWKFTRAKLNDLCQRIDAHRDRAGLPLAV